MESLRHWLDNATAQFFGFISHAHSPFSEEPFMDRRTLTQKVTDALAAEFPSGLSNEQLAHRLDENMPSIRRVTLGLYNAGTITRVEYSPSFEYRATAALRQVYEGLLEARRRAEIAGIE